MAAPPVLHVRVVSPVTTVFEGDALSLVVPAWDGKMGILPGHAPLIGLLGGGTLELDLPGGGSATYFLNRGVVKVEEDRVTILSEYASDEVPADFDPGSAWLELEPADPDAVDLEAMAGPENPLV
jgi:F-type H+-transporting ATPase subunit epsilon